MSSNINFNRNTGRYSMYSLKSVPWHSLGQVVQDSPKTMKEVIVMSGLNFEVKKKQVEVVVCTSAFGNNIYKDVPNTYATYRTDTTQVFGAVGSAYEVVSNQEAFTFLDGVLGEGQFEIETAGALGQGETIFVTAKVPGHMRLGNGDDIVDKYILFTNNHDGSSMVRAMLTPIRVVCNNTLNAALKNNTNAIGFKHTKNAHTKLDRGIEFMGLSNIYFNEMEIALNAMREIIVKDEHVQTLACDIILTSKEIEMLKANNNNLRTVEEISSYKKNRVAEIIGSVYHGPGQDLHVNTGLWFFNGITSYYGNTVEYKTDSDKFKSLTDGTASKEVQKLFDKITAKI